MDVAALASAKWTVSTRRDGEVLAVWAGGDGLYLGVLATPGSFTPEEFQGWLEDLANVSRETSRVDISLRPIPAILHQALTGLLFSHAELWERAGGMYCSIALVTTATEVAVGWVGEADVRVTRDGESDEPEWVTVRDDEGREARAASLAPARALHFSLDWNAGVDSTTGVRVEADWPTAPSRPSSSAGHGVAGEQATVLELSELDAVPLPESAETIEDEDDLGAAIASAMAAHADHADTIEPSEELIGGEVDTELAVADEGSDVALAESTADVAPPDEGAEPDPTDEDDERPRGRLSKMWDRVSGIWRPGDAPSDGVAESEAEPLIERGAKSMEPVERLEPPFEPLRAAADMISAPIVAQPTEVKGLTGPFDFSSPPRPSISKEARPPVAETPATSAEARAEAAAPVEEAEVAEPVPMIAEPAPLDESVAPRDEHAPPAEPDPASEAPATADAPPAAEAHAVADAPPTAEAHAVADAPPAAEAHAVADAPPAVEEHAATAEASLLPSLESPLAPVLDASAAAETSAPPEIATPAPEAKATPARKSAAAPGAHAAVERSAKPAVAVERAPIKSQWPTVEEMAPVPLYNQWWLWVIIIGAIFVGGWHLGGLPADTRVPLEKLNPVARILNGLGMGGGRFDALVNSEPPGAWISVDGREISRRTPYTVQLKPGTHQMTLTVSNLGSATFPVSGKHGDHVPIDEPMWGSLSIDQDNASVPVSVEVDGRAVGFAPVTVDTMTPGAHEVRFSGPDMTPWAQTVEVRVRAAARIVAHPMIAPATGVLVVRATLSDVQGSAPLSGGEVWIDGQMTGRTPFTVELPRGPHSVRVTYRDETSLVQVIDLPGGNQRFAVFELGLNVSGPRLTFENVVTRVPASGATPVAVTLEGVSLSDVREMWLHVHGADGPWKRYALDIRRAPTGVMGVVDFPLAEFDATGHTQYYLSALIATGDEYFTEMTPAQLAPVDSSAP